MEDGEGSDVELMDAADVPEADAGWEGAEAGEQVSEVAEASDVPGWSDDAANEPAPFLGDASYVGENRVYHDTGSPSYVGENRVYYEGDTATHIGEDRVYYEGGSPTYVGENRVYYEGEEPTYIGEERIYHNS